MQPKGTNTLMNNLHENDCENIGCKMGYVNGSRNLNIFCNEVTWASCRPEFPATPLFVQPFFRRLSKKTTEPALLALCKGNPPVIDWWFPSQRASHAERISMSPWQPKYPIILGMFQGDRFMPGLWQCNHGMSPGLWVAKIYKDSS